MKRNFKGAGSLNSAINALPFELHLVGYNYCGPGTRLKERLARGDKPINPLDKACQEHDIAYNNNKDLPSRLKADSELANKAWNRYKSKDVPWGEKIAAWLVTTGMKAKTKIGGKVGKRSKNKKTKQNVKTGSYYKRKCAAKTKPISFSSIVRQARSAMSGAGIKLKKGILGNDVKKAASHALKAIRKMMKNRRRSLIKWSSKNQKERVLPIPKSGGVLPLLPIFAGLSAIGSLAGGAAGVVKTVGEIKDARRKLAELQRHNQTMEALALRQGKGLFLKPYKKGLGLYMSPYLKQAKNL